jgi:hypothetical protein
MQEKKALLLFYMQISFFGKLAIWYFIEGQSYKKAKHIATDDGNLITLHPVKRA